MPLLQSCSFCCPLPFDVADRSSLSWMLCKDKSYTISIGSPPPWEGVGGGYITPKKRKTSLRFATIMRSSSMPMPMYSALTMNVSLGLRRNIIS